MKRADALKAMRLAGIEDDRLAFYRLYAEHRINRAVAEAAWKAGRVIANSFADRADVQRKPEILSSSPTQGACRD